MNEEPVVPIDEVGDHRLSAADFMATFQLPKRGIGRLALQHPFPREDRIHFDEETHTYTYDGVKVPR